MKDKMSSPYIMPNKIKTIINSTLWMLFLAFIALLLHPLLYFDGIRFGLPIVLFPPYYRLHHFWKSNLECIKTQGLVDFCISNCRRGKHCFVNLYIFLCEKLGRERCIDGVIVLI